MTTVAVLYAGCEIAADIEPGRPVGEYRLFSIDHDAWKEWWWEHQVEGVTLLRPVSTKAILHYLSNYRSRAIDDLLMDKWNRQEKRHA
jgi:hypothetical protein